MLICTLQRQSNTVCISQFSSLGELLLLKKLEGKTYQISNVIYKWENVIPTCMPGGFGHPGFTSCPRVQFDITTLSERRGLSAHLDGKGESTSDSSSN